MFCGFILLGMIAGPALAAVTCIKVGDQATATWFNAAGKTCLWTGEVGGNFGLNPVNNGE